MLKMYKNYDNLLYRDKFIGEIMYERIYYSIYWSYGFIYLSYPSIFFEFLTIITTLIAIYKNKGSTKS